MTDERLLLKFLDGTITDEERKQFDIWMEKSDDNRKLVQDLRRVWETREAHSPGDFDTRGEWDRLARAMGSQKRSVVRRIRPRTYLKFAAALVMLMVASVIIYRMYDTSKNIVHATADETRQVTLPDGSLVTLNRYAKISYRDNFAEDRILILQGEAFFDVKADLRHPFRVETSGSAVTVVGTSFNARAIAVEKLTKVFVVTGKVSLVDKDVRSQAVLLGPGLTGLLDESRNAIRIDSALDENATAWKTKKLVFGKTPLDRVLKTVANYFNVELRASDKAILRCHFTGTFGDPTLEEVIETLQEALSLEVRRENSGYVFKGEGCHDH
ncbi:MAG TPA: FecR domain-containing protein [Chryseosolibacter sp.]|nr:FecR domain-containing protein [Chryseosolibacter sp.]